MLEGSLPSIYCVMMTGKDDDRYKFVSIALENFFQQTYPNKKMVVINHGNKSIFDVNQEWRTKDVHEIMFDKTYMTLGDMRNFAVDMIPFGAIWTVWDDDDWRHNKYIEVLYKALSKARADVVFIKNRLDYNINNKFVYRCKFDLGMPFFLAKKTEVVRYLSKDSLEDIRLHNDFELHDKRITMIDNDPRLYIRLLHGKNTSLYVDDQKSQIVHYSDESHYHEYDATVRERDYAQKIIETYFNKI